MNDLENRVCRLLFKDRLSTCEAAQRLNMTPAEVVSIAARSRPQTPSVSKNSEKGISETEEEQINRLRLQVRQGLLERTRPGAIEEIPAHALVRLWSLVEDQKLIHGDASGTEDPVLDSLSAEVRTQIIALLDQAEEE